MVGPMKAGAWGSKPGVGGPTDSSRVGDGAKRQPRDGMVPNMGARKPPNAGGGQRRGTSDSYQEEVIGPRALLDGAWQPAMRAFASRRHGHAPRGLLCGRRAKTLYQGVGRLSPPVFRLPHAHARGTVAAWPWRRSRICGDSRTRMRRPDGFEARRLVFCRAAHI